MSLARYLSKLGQFLNSAGQLTNLGLASDAVQVGMKNRIINGAMVINQRGFGTVPADGDYMLDRWKARLSQASKYRVDQSSTVPSGFKNSMLITSQSAYTPLAADFFFATQVVEGFNSADFAWGTAGAQTVTLSFWVRSSLTGTFGGSVRSASSTANYPFSFTINSANTFEYKTIVITGPTSGTFNTDNSGSLEVGFCFGAGSNYTATPNTWTYSVNALAPSGMTNLVATSGATMFITGVQLEKGSTATSFDYRPYGTELALCQRYYFRITGSDSYSPIGVGTAYNSTTAGRIQISFPVPMRSAPTPSFGGTISLVGNTASAVGFTLGTTYGGKLSLMQDISWTGAMSAAGVGIVAYTYNTSSDYFQLSAEL